MNIRRPFDDDFVDFRGDGFILGDVRGDDVLHAGGLAEAAGGQEDEDETVRNSALLRGR